MKTIKNNRSIKNNCDCVFCKNNIDFQIPEPLVQALLEGKLVVFAGAGISTEVPTVFPLTLYKDIKAELGIDEKIDLDFPTLMSKYCEEKGRSKLLQKIKERFDYLSAFPELKRNATRFHEELSSIFQIKDIITTNWDTFFEDNCGALPMVTAQDFAFWDNPGRKVFKIHGSMNNIGSIVATKEDYLKAYKNLNSGIIGTSLKLLLATKTVLFVGYSFGDSDFNKIYNFLKKEMGGILPRTYLITPRKAPNGFNGTVINTDGTYFFNRLKEHLVKNKYMIDDTRFENIYTALFDLREIHNNVSRISVKKSPALIYCTSYQDGMIHAFERIISLRKTGYYSHVCNITNTIDNYEILRKKKVKNRNYFDVAYIDGYLNGISYLWLDDKMRKKVPFFYLYGIYKNLNNPKLFLKLLKKTPKIHKQAFKLAIEISQKYNSEILHHTPFLY